MRICIVSPDIVGPISNGGIGSACSALARTLAADGHDVTLLYASLYYEHGDAAYWQSHYKKCGICFIGLDTTRLPRPHRAPTVYDEDNIAHAYDVYETLKTIDFDVIHFVDHLGRGYFCVLAKREGLRFARTLLVVTAHAPTLWARLANDLPLDDLSYAVRDQMERKLVEHCDLLISPTAYMLRWMEEQGWRLPANRRVLANLMPPGVPPADETGPASRPRIREVVFFGRIEPRKGLYVFCDALDRIYSQLPPEFGVTFLGKLGDGLSEDALRRRTARWGRHITVLANLDTFQASAYLRDSGRFAVIPSLADNAPYTVMECLFHRVSFIASAVGGVPELIDDAEHDAVLFAPTPAALADRLLGAYAEGMPPPARASLDFDAIRSAHLDLHQTLGDAPAAAVQARAPARRPAVTVAVLHYERPLGLANAIQSIDRQTCRPQQIVVVDNGSRSAAASAYLDQLQRQRRDDVAIIRLPENMYEPRARNLAAEHATGDFVLFMDDDNLAKPQELDLFSRAAEAAGFDILTCFSDHFAGDAPPDDEAAALKRFIVLGDAGNCGLFFNTYGDLNCFVRREAFLGIGGFVVDGRFNHAEDWRFFAKATARGLSIGVVPEALFWYRATAPSEMSWRKRDRNGALFRAAEAIEGGSPGSRGAILLLAQGLFWKALDAERDRLEARAESDRATRAHCRADEALERLRLDYDTLRDEYGALARFVLSDLAPNLGGAPEIARALAVIRRGTARYR